MSSGVTDCMVLMPVLRSHSTISVSTDCLALTVAAFTGCCCRSAAQAWPFPYRSRHCVWLGCVALKCGAMEVAHSLELCKLMSFGSRLGTACRCTALLEYTRT